MCNSNSQCLRLCFFAGLGLNAGMARRFNLSDAIRFEDFTKPELESIMLGMIAARSAYVMAETVEAALRLVCRKRGGGWGGRWEDSVEAALRLVCRKGGREGVGGCRGRTAIFVPQERSRWNEACACCRISWGLSPPPPRSLSVCLSVCLPLSLCLSVSLSVCLSASLSLSVSFSLSLSLSLKKFTLTRIHLHTKTH